MTRRSRGRSWAMWQISEELLRPWKQQSRLYFEKVVSWNRSGPDTVNWSDVSSKLWIHAGEKFQRKGRSFKLGCGSSSSELNLRTESGPAAGCLCNAAVQYLTLLLFIYLFKQTSSTCDMLSCFPDQTVAAPWVFRCSSENVLFLLLTFSFFKKCRFLNI